MRRAPRARRRSESGHFLPNLIWNPAYPSGFLQVRRAPSGAAPATGRDIASEPHRPPPYRRGPPPPQPFRAQPGPLASLLAASTPTSTAVALAGRSLTTVPRPVKNHYELQIAPNSAFYLWYNIVRFCARSLARLSPASRFLFSSSSGSGQIRQGRDTSSDELYVRDLEIVRSRFVHDDAFRIW